MNERKKFSSDDVYLHHAARLAKDPDVFPSTKTGRDGKPLGPLVRLTFTSESHRDNTVTIWWEAKVRDFDANIATFLAKGDTLAIEGKPIMEEYQAKDGTRKTSLRLENARIHVNYELFAKCQERGFTPGAVKGGGGNSTAPKTGARKAPARQVEDVFFGDDEA